jgi:hypothetical protein
MDWFDPDLILLPAVNVVFRQEGGNVTFQAAAFGCPFRGGGSALGSPPPFFVYSRRHPKNETPGNKGPSSVWRRRSAP